MSLFIKKKAIKKAISVVAMVATVTVMSNVGFLSTSLLMADTVADGALIKSNATNPDGTPTFSSLDVYIVKLVGTKQFKRLVLNPTVFNSYGHLNWEDIQTVSQSVMDSYTTSGLVRVDTDPDEKVYALAPDGDVGAKSWVNVTASEFLGVAGSEDGDSIYTINSTDSGYYTAVGDITTTTGLETFYSAGTLPDAPVAGGELTATLSSDTPAAGTLPKAASSVEVMKFNLTAGEATNVDSITVNRVGVGVASDFANVYLYEGATRLTSGRSIGSSTNSVEFANLGISMSTGEVKALSVKVDVATGATAGDIHSFELSSASVIEGPDDVSGSFPVRGNAVSIGSQSVSTVIVTKGTTPSNPTVGEAGAILSEFKLQAGANDVSVENITLINAGTTNSANISEVGLYAGSELVASVTEMTGDYMVFALDTPYTIAQGITRVFQVKGSLAGRSGLTVKTYVEYSADILAVDATYDVGAYIDIDTSGTFDGSSTGTKYIEITSQGGRVTVAHNGPSTSDVSKGGQDVHFYEFAMTANEQQVEVKSIGMTIDGTAVSGNGYACGGTTETFTDLKIIDVDTGKTLMGPREYACTANNTSSGLVTFTDSFYIDAGETLNLAFTVDIRSSEATASDFLNDSFATTISAFGDSSVREVDSGDYLTATTDIVPYLANVGNSLTVKSSSLAVVLASTPVSSTRVKRAIDVDSLGLSFTAGTQSAALISAISLTGVGDLSNAASYTVAEFDDVVSSVSLWDGATQVGTTESPSATGVLSFTNLNWTVDAGVTKRLVVKANLTSNCGVSNDDYYYLTLNSTDVTATDDDSNTITLTASSSINGDKVDGTTTAPTIKHLVRATGTIASAVDSATPTSTIVVAGTSDVEFSKVKLSATYEAMKVTKMRITNVGNATYGDDEIVDVTISYPKESGTGTATGYLSSGDANFTLAAGEEMYVPKDDSAVVTIKVNLNTIADGADSGNQPQFGLSASGFEAEGVDSGDKTTSITARNGSSMTVRKTVPTISLETLPSGTLASGTMTIAKFKITANSGADVAVKKLTFDLTLSDADAAASTDLTIASPAIYDASDPGTAITITSGDGAGGTAYEGQSKILIEFTSEEVISKGNSKTYLLKAAITNAAQYDSIITRLAAARESAVRTAFLDSTPDTSTNELLVLDSAVAGGGTEYNANIIWSDNSAGTSHSATSGSSSEDWTNGYMVKILPSDYQSLSY
ncbi:MAG: hypothetical protein KAQ87_02880 [Candidatus Pacebacteria bacterium]|nr:hypothetical protein [Candidatus Paceibacterota bacterium]